MRVEDVMRVLELGLLCNIASCSRSSWEIALVMRLFGRQMLDITQRHLGAEGLISTAGCCM